MSTVVSIGKKEDAAINPKIVMDDKKQFQAKNFGETKPQ